MPNPSSIETSCTVLFHTEKASAVQQEEIMRDLENPDVKVSEAGNRTTWRSCSSGGSKQKLL